MKDIIERQGGLRGEREQLNVFSPRPVGQTCGLNLASLCGDQLQNTSTNINTDTITNINKLTKLGRCDS